MRIQGLPPTARALIWWMVGSAPFFQLELFYHTEPRQQALPRDWRPCDYGWGRIGITTRDFDRVTAGADRWGLARAMGRSTEAGMRRLCFRDPFMGIPVEVSESWLTEGPALRYAATSVADLAAARSFYIDTLGGVPAPLELLHLPEDEALWGLAGAEREGFLAKFGDICVEVVSYRQPRGRCIPERHIGDQGIMNIGIGSRDARIMEAVLERVRARGHRLTSIFRSERTLGTYIIDPGCEVELLAIPEESDLALGFAATGPFLGEFG